MKKDKKEIKHEEPLKTIKEKEQRLMARVKELEEKLAQASAENIANAKRNEELVEINKNLHSSITSYKSANTRLKKDIEHYKALGKEGDELNEQRLAEIDSLRDRLKDAEECVNGKGKVIDGLNDQAMGFRETISAQEALIKDLRGDLKAYEANTDWFNALPWWRKMFTKL